MTLIRSPYPPRIIITALTGECCLFQLHGIKPSKYNPFTLAHKWLTTTYGIPVKKSREAILRELDKLANNPEVGGKTHPLYNRTIKTFEKSKS